MAKYVMSDLHGQYQKFIKMLEKIDFNEKDELYIIGDIFDRGPQSLEIFDYVLGKPNIHLLRGNHEELLIDALESYSFQLWYFNGGQTSHNQLLEKYWQYNDSLVKYLKRRPLVKVVDDKYILVHAELTLPSGYEEMTLDELLSQQNADDNLWSREKVGIECKFKDYVIISGHTPVQSITGDPSTNQMVRIGNNIYIDCGCAYGEQGTLGCLRLDDLEEFYV